MLDIKVGKEERKLRMISPSKNNHIFEKKRKIAQGEYFY